MIVRRLVVLAASATLALAVGCAPYQVKGKVIEGDISFIAVVDANDPRLEGPGVGGVRIALETDPGKLNREQVGQTVSDVDGSFTIPFNEVGAGLLLYDVGVEARGNGYIGAEHMFNLPPSNKRILVILQPGVDRRRDEPTANELYERFR